MIIYLQISKDPLEVFNADKSTKLKSAFPDVPIISLDNYSEEWLIKKTIDHSRSLDQVSIIITRENDAEPLNLKPLLIQLNRMTKVHILYQGSYLSLVHKLGAFRNVTLSEVSEGEDLITAAKVLFKDQ